MASHTPKGGNVVQDARRATRRGLQGYCIDHYLICFPVYSPQSVRGQGEFVGRRAARIALQRIL